MSSRLSWVFLYCKSVRGVQDLLFLSVLPFFCVEYVLSFKTMHFRSFALVFYTGHRFQVNGRKLYVSHFRHTGIKKNVITCNHKENTYCSVTSIYIEEAGIETCGQLSLFQRNSRTSVTGIVS